ncbi:Haloacid type II [Mycena kentingensis (nom. inval.)]|nr:Haloacid type II [Mycena kentingensis (nom. inval.)]
MGVGGPMAAKRVAIACSNCRKRKVKCITTEDPPEHPCRRCTEKGLVCQYISVSDDMPSEPGYYASSPSRAPPAAYWPDGSPALQPVPWSGYRADPNRPAAPYPPPPRFSSGQPMNAAPAGRVQGATPWSDAAPGQPSHILALSRSGTEPPFSAFSRNDRYLPPPPAMLLQVREEEARRQREMDLKRRQSSSSS